MAVRRGVTQLGIWQTVTTTFHVLVPEVGQSDEGLGDGTDVNGVMSADWGMGHFAMALQAAATTVTQTLYVFAHCRV